jgi:hypothetical protein
MPGLAPPPTIRQYVPRRSSSRSSSGCSVSRHPVTNEWQSPATSGIQLAWTVKLVCDSGSVLAVSLV